MDRHLRGWTLFVAIILFFLLSAGSFASSTGSTGNNSRPKKSDCLFGSHRLQERLGSGAYADVFWAHKRTIDGFDEPVVIKILKGYQKAHPDEPNPLWVRRFLHEYNLLQRLQSPLNQHPHIIQVQDMGHTILHQPDGSELHRYFMTFEPFKARSLRDILDEATEPLDLIPAVRIALQMAKGIIDIFDSGITHRDIKAQNTLVKRDLMGLHVKLMDFGLARKISGDPFTQQDQKYVLGTPHYMAAELLQDRKHLGNIQTDLFALGVTMYLMLTLEYPFAGSSSFGVHNSILRGQYSPLLVYRRDVPEKLTAIITKLLSSDEIRYENPNQLISDLEEVLRIIDPTVRFVVREEGVED
jgi:eukaryotic-like serine/threonine-protein kinase